VIVPDRVFFFREEAEQRGLSCPVRADDAHDRAGRNLERELVDQQAIAVALRHACELDDLVPQALGDGNKNLLGLVSLLSFIGRQFFKACEPRLRLRLPPFGFWRTHSSSACIALIRAASWLASSCRRFSFCSSQLE
jgi:hypothetical protein